ncbi:hypothetical protein CBS101457_005655 [Exobasidium rhododendri]|nr:hypothetical protein CBS101457_005655 [Exobasidium rhododendri]
MPPRNQQASGSSSSSNKKAPKGSIIQANEQPDEDPLVAIILADSFDEHFTPLTLTTPRCLLTLANVPLLNYSIESAVLTGVSQIYILACAHSEQIRKYIETHLLSTLRSQGITITVINTPEARSEGDALRELDAKQVLRSDFLLYRADSVCTFDLRIAVAEHKRRRKADKDVIMTMCCMPVQEQTDMRSKAVRPVQYIDPSNNQVLHYELQHTYPPSKASLPYELLRLEEKTGYDEIDVRQDLVEAGVDVCSIDVPPLFSENFDYQSLSLDFIPGILTSDLLDSKFFLQIYQKGYAGRARDTATYDAISKSILRRWTFPITPANSAWIGEDYSERKGWKYIGDGVKSDRTSTIGTGTMLGSDCSLAAYTEVRSSVLGKGVKVAMSSQLVDCHVHAKASIGKNVKISGCIIGQGAIVLDDVVLGKGCLIGAGCIVGPNVRLRAGSRVGLKERESFDDSDEEDDSGEGHAYNGGRDARLGEQSKGFLWTNLWEDRSGKEEDDSDAEENGEQFSEDVRNLRLRSIGYEDQALQEMCDNESVSSIDEDSDFSDLGSGEDDDEDEEGRSAISSSTFSNLAGVNVNLTLDDQGDTKQEQEASDARSADFILEATASLQRAMEEGHTIDNASIELKTLRMASNVALSEVRMVTIDVLLSKLQPSNAKQVQQLMTRWSGLITRVSSDDEPEAIGMIQSYCASHTTHMALFVPFLKMFYNDDVFEEESIVAWWRGKGSQTGSDARKELRQKSQAVIRYILEAQDESEEE